MFELDYCEYACHNRNQERIYRPNGLGMYLFLRFYTPMRFVLNDEIVFSQPGACLLFTPEYPQDYEALQEFQNSYVHFKTVENLEKYDLPQNQIFYPHHLEEVDELFSKIQAEFISSSKFKVNMLDTLLQQLLIETTRQLEFQESSDELSALQLSFRKLRLTLLTECEKDWKISELCQQVHLEKSQFYNYYESFFSISPKADLLKARINKAKHLLSNQAAIIQEVALACGFSSASHFSRQFKRSTGISPKEYQKRELSRIK